MVIIIMSNAHTSLQFFSTIDGEIENSAAIKHTEANENLTFQQQLCKNRLYEVGIHRRMRLAIACTSSYIVLVTPTVDISTSHMMQLQGSTHNNISNLFTGQLIGNFNLQL